MSSGQNGGASCSFWKKFCEKTLKIQENSLNAHAVSHFNLGPSFLKGVPKLVRLCMFLVQWWPPQKHLSQRNLTKQTSFQGKKGSASDASIPLR
jgi:hypothetical protein